MVYRVPHPSTPSAAAPAAKRVRGTGLAPGMNSMNALPSGKSVHFGI